MTHPVDWWIPILFALGGGLIVVVLVSAIRCSVRWLRRPRRRKR